MAVARTHRRQWPAPRRPWVMTQTWNDLLFAHWMVPTATLRAVVPDELELDTFDGVAWIGVVPFHMTNVGPRGIAVIPGISTFPEINVRTYVSLDGKPGVYFFSLDADNRAAVEFARRLLHLQYFHARIAVLPVGEAVHYDSRRIDERGGPSRFVADYKPTGDVWQSESGSLAYWLTERYCLYSVGRTRRVYRVEIDHAPWPLQNTNATIENNTMTAELGIDTSGPPLLYFARRQDVVVWTPDRVR